MCGAIFLPPNNLPIALLISIFITDLILKATQNILFFAFILNEVLENICKTKIKYICTCIS